MIPFPKKKYSVIYADPPWSYAAGGKKRNVTRHYHTMKPEDIYDLPVQDIAADWDVLPLGTVVYIDGLGERVVQDRGGAIKGNAVDVYFEDHDEALVFGRQTVRLYIVEGGDGP